MSGTITRGTANGAHQVPTFSAPIADLPLHMTWEKSRRAHGALLHTSCCQSAG